MNENVNNLLKYKFLPVFVNSDDYNIKKPVQWTIKLFLDKKDVTHVKLFH